MKTLWNINRNSRQLRDGHPRGPDPNAFPESSAGQLGPLDHRDLGVELPSVPQARPPAPLSEPRVTTQKDKHLRRPDPPLRDQPGDSIDPGADYAPYRPLVWQGPDHGAATFRVLFGLIWLVDATLKWLPGFRNGYMETIMGQAEGQPRWLDPWFNFWINLQHPNPGVFAYLVAILETIIAVALIVGFARKLVYIGAIILSLLIWGTAEGFGGPYTAGAADVGTAVVYALVFALLLTISYQGTPRLSVDYLLEQRISWWHWVAEVGHHRQHRRHFRLNSRRRFRLANK